MTATWHGATVRRRIACDSCRCSAVTPPRAMMAISGSRAAPSPRPPKINTAPSPTDTHATALVGGHTRTARPFEGRVYRRNRSGARYCSNVIVSVASMASCLAIDSRLGLEPGLQIRPVRQGQQQRPGGLRLRARCARTMARSRATRHGAAELSWRGRHPQTRDGDRLIATHRPASARRATIAQ